MVSFAFLLKEPIQTPTIYSTKYSSSPAVTEPQRSLCLGEPSECPPSTQGTPPGEWRFSMEDLRHEARHPSIARLGTIPPPHVQNPLGLREDHLSLLGRAVAVVHRADGFDQDAHFGLGEASASAPAELEVRSSVQRSEARRIAPGCFSLSLVCPACASRCVGRTAAVQ